MISDEKALEIVGRLLEKSRANQVDWRVCRMRRFDASSFFRAAPPKAPQLSDIKCFIVHLPESSVEIAFYSPSADLDRYVVSFKNKAGTIVKMMDFDEENPSWEIAAELFDEAGRVAVGWDRVLDDIERAVTSQDKIGSTPDSAGETEPSQL